jgi:hypothetical protein
VFHFGSPDDTAEVCWKAALNEGGPGLRECPLDELDTEELRVALTYNYIALQDAYLDGQVDEVVSILKKEYDAVFRTLAEASEEFRETVKNNQHVYAGGYSKENILYYKKLAGVA